MFNKKLVCFSLMLLIITIGAVSAAENMTENDLQSTNEINTTFEDVQNAIEKAEINSTIILNGTYKGNGEEISITKDITLDGLGKTTLDANHKSGILNIHSSNVILKNINFINAKSPEKGGAITTNAKLTVINCSFIDNTVDNGYRYNRMMDGFYYASEYTGSGGAINADNDLTVINSTFKNNSAHLWAYYRDMGYTTNSDEGTGGAINCFGYLHLENSNFTKNAHHSIYAGNSEILNCNFVNQDVFEACTNCNVTFINSTFTKCGEIKSYYYDINLYIDNCSFKNAKSGLIDIFQTGNAVINNSRFENNSIRLYDTSLIEIDGYAKIINTTFIKNTVSLTGILDLKKYKLTNCTFIGNSPGTIISSDKLFDDDFNRIYLKVKVNDQPAKVYYNSGKSVKIDSNYNYNVAIYRNGKAYEGTLKQTYQFTYIPVSTWKAGTYKITLKPVESYIKSTTFKVTVLKAPTVIKAPKITAKYKKSKYFTVKVTHKITKKAVKNTFVKLKIGKKTYKIKTNTKGIAKFNTKQLNIGTHKVEITSGNSNYKISAKSQIKIKR